MRLNRRGFMQGLASVALLPSLAWMQSKPLGLVDLTPEAVSEGFKVWIDEGPKAWSHDVSRRETWRYSDSPEGPFDKGAGRYKAPVFVWGCETLGTWMPL